MPQSQTQQVDTNSHPHHTQKNKINNEEEDDEEIWYQHASNAKANKYPQNTRKVINPNHPADHFIKLKQQQQQQQQ